jgi:hypothetical protein
LRSFVALLNDLADVAFLIGERVHPFAVPGKDCGDTLGMPEFAMAPTGWLLNEPGPFEVSDQLPKFPRHWGIVSY